MNPLRKTPYSMLVSEVMNRTRNKKGTDPFVLNLLKEEFAEKRYRLPRDEIDILKSAYHTPEEAAWLENHVAGGE